MSEVLEGRTVFPSELECAVADSEPLSFSRVSNNPFHPNKEVSPIDSPP